MEKIKSITEAYSTQPVTLEVYNNSNKLQKEVDVDDILCKEIKLETTNREGDPYECYKGYNYKGNLIFEYWKGSVNVHYFI